MQVNVAEKIKPCGTNNQTMCSFTENFHFRGLRERAEAEAFCV